jgi:hypothetical protein
MRSNFLGEAAALDRVRVAPRGAARVKPSVCVSTSILLRSLAGASMICGWGLVDLWLVDDVCRSARFGVGADGGCGIPSWHPPASWLHALCSKEAGAAALDRWPWGGRGSSGLPSAWCGRWSATEPLFLACFSFAQALWLGG